MCLVDFGVREEESVLYKMNRGLDVRTQVGGEWNGVQIG